MQRGKRKIRKRKKNIIGRRKEEKEKIEEWIRKKNKT